MKTPLLSRKKTDYTVKGIFEKDIREIALKFVEFVENCFYVSEIRSNAQSTYA